MTDQEPKCSSRKRQTYLLSFNIENIRIRLAFKKRNRSEFACDLSHIAIIQLLQQIIVFIRFVYK